jgi:hypothetical protein
LIGGYASGRRFCLHFRTNVNENDRFVYIDAFMSLVASLHTRCHACNLL